MHIVLYHDALIPPPKYGGTERIVDWLAKALLALGHRVTLIARPGSHVEGAQTIPVQPDRHWEELVPSDADILHLWGTPGQPPKKPFLVTIQGNGKPGERFHPNTVFISQRHASNHGGRHFVYNGIDPDDYPCDSQRADHLVFLAKASWKVKNLIGAIEIARAARAPLTVMGSRSWPLQIQRYLPAYRGVRYLGMVGDVEKRKILRNARALLFPVRWPEPFGIAITEALAAGCPVFGTPYGSLPEIVNEKVGTLSDDASVLLNALQTRKITPADCRARVYQGFTHQAMAESYVTLYKKVLADGSLETQAPICQLKESSENLLPWQSLAKGK